MGQPSSTQSRTEDEIQKKPPTLLLLDTKDHFETTSDNSTADCGVSIIDSWAKSQTEEVDIRCLEAKRYSPNLVFGPCLKDLLLDNVNSMQRVIETTDRAFVKCCEGFDAILLVFRFDTTITQEDVSVLETLKVILGKNYLKHVIVLTIWPPFTENQCRFDDWCRKQGGPFQKLFKACNNRCVLVNTFLGDEERQIADSNRLAKLAYELKSRHGCYTISYYKLNEPNRERLIITLKERMLEEKIKKQADILLAMIKEYYKQRKELDRATQKLSKLTKKLNSNSLLKELITIFRKTGETSHNVEGKEGEPFLTKQLKKIAHYLASCQETCFIKCLKVAADEFMRSKMEKAIDIEDQMKRARSTIEKYEGPCASDREEINEAIRKLKDEVTTEDISHGQLKHLMKIVENVEKRFHSIEKIPKLLETLEKIKKAAKNWSKINTVISFITIFPFPVTKIPIKIIIGILCAIVTCLIAAVEFGTDIHIFVIDYTMM